MSANVSELYIYIVYVEQPIIDAKILNMFNISTILTVPTENRIIIISCMTSYKNL